VMSPRWGETNSGYRLMRYPMFAKTEKGGFKDIDEVRHGAYISIYCNLKSVSVSKGQKVSARQALGAIGADNILQFQLRKETAKLNPEFWLGR